MSPSPATGLSKGEREREINSTSFGECKTVPRMYLCLVMSCSGVIAALWRGALHHQGSLAGPYTKVSHEGAKYLLYCVLASSRFHRRRWGAYHVPVLSMSFPGGLWHSPLLPFLLMATEELFLPLLRHSPNGLV